MPRTVRVPPMIAPWAARHRPLWRLWCGFALVLGGMLGVVCAQEQTPALSGWDILNKLAAGPRRQNEVRAFAWPESGRAARASIVARLDKTATGERRELRIDYTFPDSVCRQVVVDLPVRAGESYARLEFYLRGDGASNRIEVWLGAAGRWFGLGRTLPAGTVRRRVVLPVNATDTDVADTLRFCIVQDGGLGAHRVVLDTIRFVGPVAPRHTDLHVFGRGIPASVRALPDRPRSFKVDIVPRSDRNVVLLDGTPLFCVLDARANPKYLESARRTGVNAFALDLYWRMIEPRRGYREWARLKEWLGELSRVRGDPHDRPAAAGMVATREP
ncbi:MAG: hypothetical protein GXP31_13425 [Kiritimatiellaeota bacterium]|nr:hypothetical protein [Kiritimatiellota bacterium]